MNEPRLIEIKFPEEKPPEDKVGRWFYYTEKFVLGFAHVLDNMPEPLKIVLGILTLPLGLWLWWKIGNYAIDIVKYSWSICNSIIQYFGGW